MLLQTGQLLIKAVTYMSQQNNLIKKKDKIIIIIIKKCCDSGCFIDTVTPVTACIMQWQENVLRCCVLRHVSLCQIKTNEGSTCTSIAPLSTSRHICLELDVLQTSYFPYYLWKCCMYCLCCIRIKSIIYLWNINLLLICSVTLFL